MSKLALLKTSCMDVLSRSKVGTRLIKLSIRHVFENDLLRIVTSYFSESLSNCESSLLPRKPVAPVSRIRFKVDVMNC